MIVFGAQDSVMLAMFFYYIYVNVLSLRLHANV